MTDIDTQPLTTNTRTIATNSVWYGVETGLEFVAAFICTVMMSRMIGPQKLGYFTYVMWLSNVSGAAASLGIPTTARKYMAEYLGKGEFGTVRAIFGATLRLQTAMAATITAVAIGVVLVAGDPAYRWASLFQVASIFPSMAVFVPSQANAAKADMKANVAGSLVGTFLYLSAVVLSLWLGWGVLGIAIGIFLSRCMELIVRLVPVLRWVRLLPVGRLPSDLKRRMMMFSGQGTALMLLSLVVWERSDMIFLKMLSPDIRQVTFFAVAFNLTQRAFIVPETLGVAIGASIMVQYGRDKSLVPRMVTAATRYLLLFSTPLLLGMAALSAPLMTLIYGRQYLPAIPVLAVAAILAVPKALLLPMQQALQAHEQQTFLLVWTSICGLLNVGLDFALIPRFAATGAALASGSAQLIAITGMCIWASKSLHLKWEAQPIIKIVFAATLMGVVVALVSRVVTLPVNAVLIGIPLGAVCFLFALRAFRVLTSEDRYRMLQMSARVPEAVRGLYLRTVDWMVVPERT